ncbi:hypothetical protein D7B24_003996 [Verticillium nonalfalfae]|uniref:Conserved oligomeric Golgi complex subunit 5 n=1 Tax=Verticillium nonalfalfae TaxID=1051616 RepID=A0A3M9YGL0_9PEZI|nr:uncharacterized protein D7B24_003996 [Verticillium nonalfalfae]RNJ58906.1 hypothetical protein D7B24_003996 [Verticillium nonalfalfae]
MTSQDEEDPSYIDYEAFLAPDFKPSAFANTLVLSTNNPNDTPLDLSTPLSRVLFDTQEVDSHIDVLTTKSAIPLLEHTDSQTKSSKRIVSELDAQIKSLNDSYKQLEKDVINKHAEADEVRQVAMRLWETLRLGRSVGRCLQLGRHLEVQYTEIAGPSISAAAAAAGKREDHRALVRCAHTILSLREVFDATAPGEEGHGLHRVDAIKSLRENIVTPLERSVKETAERIVRDFSVPDMATFSQSEDIKSRTVSAMTTLYLLSPTSQAQPKPEKWTPVLLLQALETYFRTALSSSIASLARALSQLPNLDRTLAEITARCQNIVALELVLESTRPPAHPLVQIEGTQAKASSNLLQPLLAHLETGSLPSYFWRTMASSLGTRVQDIMNRGGVSARTLKTNKQGVGEAVRECVVKGCRAPSAMKGKGEKAREGSWEREVAVMVGSVLNNLGR